MTARRLLLIALALAANSPVEAAVGRHGRKAPSPAVAVFESDWVLMNWALRFYDGDGDIRLSPAEAAPAAKAFRKLADRDRDGRISPAEYRQARETILSRY